MKNYLIQLINNIRMSDLFDILIITLFLYVVLVWFKKTASRFVLIGIVILGAIYAVARIFHLYITEYIFQGFFAILAIALIIIFQEDLRRFFERLATWGIIRKGPSGISSHLDAELINSAVEKIIQEGNGALIVIKGDDLLGRHLKGGFSLEGKLSEAILESIFDPHSIGHDGAVIIEGSSIARFGCHLPLSVNPKKISNLGLRHTAALGLSERCDALCIVVSEEHGSVSIAREGKLTKLKNPKDLVSVLEKFYLERNPEGKRGAFMRFFSKNLAEKVVAIVLACGLWIAFGYQTESIGRDYVVPIVYRNLPADWIISEQDPKETTLTVMGSKQAFGLISEDSFKIVLDMAGIKDGRQEMLIGNKNVQHPSNVTVVGINPNKIKLVAHKLVSIEIPVKVTLSGALSKGLNLGKVTASPASINVKVLKKDSKKIKVETQPVNLAEISDTARLTCNLIVPPEIHSVEGGQKTVEVTVEVQPKK